jgi:hypothetical protein
MCEATPHDDLTSEKASGGRHEPVSQRDDLPHALGVDDLQAEGAGKGVIYIQAHAVPG